jgi:hypothetical protein
VTVVTVLEKTSVELVPVSRPLIYAELLPDEAYSSFFK